MAASKDQMLNFAKRLSIPGSVTSQVVVPFLDESSLCALTWSCKNYRTQFGDKHADKKIAADMLHCVLNPNEKNLKRFQELLTTEKRDKAGLALYLIQNHGEEVYIKNEFAINKKPIKKTKTFRYNTCVLEAILRTKNIHFAKALFESIPEHDKTDALKEKINVINLQEIWGMQELQTAYKNVLEHGPKSNFKNYKEKDVFSLHIGKVMKELLPWFSIYLFCHPLKHDMNDCLEPPHWTCTLYDNTQLDFDCLGSEFSLYKGNAVRTAYMTGMFVFLEEVVKIDSKAFARHSKLLSLALDRIIEHFKLNVNKQGNQDKQENQDKQDNQHNQDNQNKQDPIKKLYSEIPISKIFDRMKNSI